MPWKHPDGRPRTSPGKLSKAARNSAIRRQCPACERKAALTGFYLPDPELNAMAGVFRGWNCRWCGWTGDTAERNAAQRAAGLRPAGD